VIVVRDYDQPVKTALAVWSPKRERFRLTSKVEWRNCTSIDMSATHGYLSVAIRDCGFGFILANAARL
jgi:hypothetical protein